MPDTGFQRPTLAELIARIEADFNARIPGADSRIRRSMLSVLARVVAGVAFLLYGYLDFIARQIFADSAVDEYLIRLAAIHNVLPIEATKAQGTATVTGTNGAAINIGKILQRGDGVEYETITAATISGGTANLTVRALEPGLAGNTGSSTQLTFTSPISGVNAVATTGDLTGGAETEDTESLRTRLLDKLRQPPHGGADFDYITWAKSIAGVTRAWVYPQEDGAGSVRVRFMMDETYDDGIPESGDVAAVQAYIESVRPVTAQVFVSAPEPVEMDFSIRLKNAAGTVVTDPAVRAAVQAELLDLLQREAEPKADGTVNTTPSGKILFSHIRQAISNAAGEFDHEITVPSADLTPTNPGEVWVLGDITWLS